MEIYVYHANLYIVLEETVGMDVSVYSVTIFYFVVY